MINTTNLIALLVYINILSLIIGYILGRYVVSNGVTLNKTVSFFDKNKHIQNMNNVFIDDKKFVVDIKTDNLERKFDTLGDIKKTEENISESVNKLKNLKR